MRQLDFTPNFKKDMSNIEIEGVERIAENWGKEELNIKDVNTFGFAYTSSSSYAMHNVTNHVEFEDMSIEHFAITENDMLIMVVSDSDENYLYFEIEASDFY